MNDRRLLVLRAIIEDFVKTREPVGSKALTERHDLGVSPATVRNDMAMLEEAGYIVQPHTSAGRIPTELGYRHFVDRLDEIKPLSKPERQAIQSFLSQAVDLDDVVTRAARLLSQLTRQVAVVQYPTLRTSTLRHLELVQLANGHLLVVIITDSGRVEQHTIPATPDLLEDDVARLGRRVNEAGIGQKIVDLASSLEGLKNEFPLELQQVITTLFNVLQDTLLAEKDDRIILSGTGNLARGYFRPDYNLEPILDALEEQVVLMRLLSTMSQDSTNVAVRIGTETQHEGFTETSVVATHYGNLDEHVALLGSIGPTSIDYPATIAAVRAVALYLSQIINSN